MFGLNFGMKERPKPNKKFYIAVAAVVVAVFIIVAVVTLASLGVTSQTTTINRASCESSGGVWNECGSPCTGAPQGTVCIQVCRQQCEWYASSAAIVKNDPAYSSSVSCLRQGNGMEMCWLAAGNATA